MNTPGILNWALLPFVAFAGLLLPGYLLTRLIPSKSVALSSFLGSILILFSVVLANQLIGFPIDSLHVGGGLGLVIIGLTGAAWKKPVGVSPPSDTAPQPAIRPDHIFYLVAAALGLGSILVRAAIDPLSGFDNLFRWNGLSLEMIQTQSLSYYPAVSTNAFAHYAWCDGIAPLVSILNFWLYLGTGCTATVMTAARLTLEAGLLFAVVFQFARVLWKSRAAGWTAMGMLATSSLALWSVAMGQEAGLLTLSLVAMLYFLHIYSGSRQTADVIWAGVAAAVGALSREYGLAFLIIGAVILFFQKPLRPGISRFLVVAIAFTAPWYLRNAWMTGNPLYSLNVFGLFPVNEVYRAVMDAAYKTGSLSSHPEKLPDFLLLIPTFVGAVFLAAFAGVWRLRLKSASLVFAGMVMCLIWLWAIGQSGGGWVYSMRVLSPAIAVAAILAGNLALLPLRAGLCCGLAALSVSVDATRRSWHFPLSTLTTPWSLSFEQWAQAKNSVSYLEFPKLWSGLCKAAGNKAIIIDHPGNHTQIRRHGGEAVPLFSPRADCIFSFDKPFADIITELRARNIRFITLIDHGSLNEEFDRKYPFLQELRQNKFRLITVSNLISVYDVEAINAMLNEASSPADAPR